MRKLVIMCLAAVVGLALAGNEMWIGPNPYHSYQIPNPQPGVFPFDPGVFNPTVDTLKYDDNTAANAWAQNRAGGGWGMKFISPGDNITLAGALVYFYNNTWPVPGGNRAMVRVYADDGPSGSPGTELWASETLTITRGQWNYITIGTPVVASNFFIFYVQPDSYPVCPGMAIDAQNNAPGGRKWAYMGGTAFGEDNTRGDWLIRAAVDWTPQLHNAATMYFVTNLPRDTVPNINMNMKVMIKNLGTADMPLGTPVRLHVEGPNSYVYNDTVNTTAAIVRGATMQITFQPAWRIPNVDGDYDISAWTELAGEEWLANDTITYKLGCARWIQYFTEARLHWVSWAGPERSVLFDPSEFGYQYPIELTRVRSDFYYHTQAPWDDSTFYYRIYGEDGSTLLYESPELEAVPGTPGPYVAYSLDSALIFESGTFYVSVAPYSGAHPSTCADDSLGGKSFFGSAGAWLPFDLGEFFISASVKHHETTDVAEPVLPPVRQPTLYLANSSNPVTGPVTLKWQVPNREHVSINLYDATGRLIRNLVTSDKARAGAVTLDANSMAAGIYLVRLETGNGAATRKLVIE